MNKNLNVSTGIIWGIGLGLLYCITLYIRWNVATNFVLFGLLAFVNYALVLGLLFWEAAVRKRKDSGIAELKDLFQTLFITVLLFELFYAIFSFVYLKWINPSVIDEMKKAAAYAMNQAGTAVPEEEKKMTIQGIEDLKQNNTAGAAIKGYFTSVAVSGVLSFLIALVMRKRKPAEPQTQL